MIYVLLLENNKYYIGKTNNLEKRFLEHLNHKGCEWTKLYKPIKVVEKKKEETEFDEDIYTKKYMKKYGLSNVRGGSYVQIELPEYQRKSLQDELKTSDNLCFKCDKKGHFIKDCKSKKYDIQDIYIDENNAVDFNNRLLQVCKREFSNNVCFKCGKARHFIKDCEAKYWEKIIPATSYHPITQYHPTPPYSDSKYVYVDVFEKFLLYYWAKIVTGFNLKNDNFNYLECKKYGHLCFRCNNIGNIIRCEYENYIKYESNDLTDHDEIYEEIFKNFNNVNLGENLLDSFREYTYFSKVNHSIMKKIENFLKSKDDIEYTDFIEDLKDALSGYICDYIITFCNNKENDLSCYRCGRKSHFIKDCIAKTDINGNFL